MRSKRIPAEEQYRLIMECRQSGLTDHQLPINLSIFTIGEIKYALSIFFSDKEFIAKKAPILFAIISTDL